MVMIFSVITSDAQVIILTHSAMPACLHVVLALVAGVDKAILTLCMELHQHAHGRPLGSSK